MAKADLGITVRVSGAEKAEKQLEDVGRAAKKAGDGAKGAGQEFKSFGSRAGDASEALDKKLDQSVGRSFKGFDRLTGVIGQATGALALVTGGIALLKLGYDKLIVPQLESTKALKAQKNALAATATAAEVLTGTYEDLSSAIGVNIGMIRREDAARVIASSAVLKQAKEQLISGGAAIDRLKFERRKLAGEMVGEKRDADKLRKAGVVALTLADTQRLNSERREANSERLKLTIAEGRLAAGEKTKARLDASIIRLEKADTVKRGAVIDASARLAALSRAVAAEFADQGPPAPSPPKAPTGVAPDRSEEAALLAETERFLENETNLARMADREREKIAAQAIERDRINQSTRLALIEDETERQLEVLRIRHSAEFKLAEDADADLVGLKRKHQKEIDKISKKTDKLDKETTASKIERAAQTTQVLAGAMAEGARAMGLGVGVEMVAAGVADAGRAASYGAQALARAGAQDYFGATAYGLAAAAATAAAIKNFAGATQLGAGGGSAGGGTVTPIAPSGPPRRTDVGDGDGQGTTVINVQFTGRSFATRREIQQDLAILQQNPGRGARRAGG